MRSKFVLAVALCLALFAPASALADVGGAPTGAPTSVTWNGDTLAAYYLSPDKSQCLIFSGGQTWQRQGHGKPWFSTGMSVQLSGPDCAPSTTWVGLTSFEYKVIPLTAAYLVTPPVTVSGLTVTVDIAAVVTDGPYPLTWSDACTTWVGQTTNAHLTPATLTVTIGGGTQLWTAHQANVNHTLSQKNYC